MSTKKENFFAFLLILIFASGLAIFVWNKIQGRDLSKAPNFDLSAYNSIDLVNDLDPSIKKQISSELARAMKSKDKGENLFADKINVDNNDKGLSSGFIYFKDSFRLENNTKTTNMIQSFLDDFPELKGAMLENFDVFKTIKIELPALERDKILEEVKAHELVADVLLVKAPVWQINFKLGRNEEEIQNFINNFPDVKMLPIERTIVEGYVARASIKELKLEPAFIEKMQKEYSDVITILP